MEGTWGSNHPGVGKFVRVRDELGEWHDALVTTVHGSKLGEHAINAVYVSGDPLKTDQYGRQLERLCSLVAEGPLAAPGGRYYQVA